MEFSKIIAVSGKPGLYEILSQTKTGVIVRSIQDDKRMPITASHNVSLLDNIAIYAYSGEIPLAVIMSSISEKEAGKEASVSHKESKEKLTTYFSEILPDYDDERVYVSNIKKVIQWYNILVKSEFDFESLKQIATVTEEEE